MGATVYCDAGTIIILGNELYGDAVWITDQGRALDKVVLHHLVVAVTRLNSWLRFDQCHPVMAQVFGGNGKGRTEQVGLSATIFGWANQKLIWFGAKYQILKIERADLKGAEHQGQDSFSPHDSDK